MSIRKKPIQKDEAKINQAIEQGGSVPDEKAKKEVKQFPIRMEAGLLKLIDDHVEESPLIQNRNRWFLEAAIEKLKREGKMD